MRTPSRRMRRSSGTRRAHSPAARRMDMSYKHAWDKVDGLNKALGKPLVLAQTGGRKGGGATLTAAGQAVISHFRAIEQAATAVAGCTPASCFSAPIVRFASSRAASESRWPKATGSDASIRGGSCAGVRKAHARVYPTYRHQRGVAPLDGPGAVTE